MPKSSKKQNQSRKHTKSRVKRVKVALTKEEKPVGTLAINVKMLNVPTQVDPDQFKDYIVATTDEIIRDAITEMNDDKEFQGEQMRIIRGGTMGISDRIIGIGKVSPELFLERVSNAITQYSPEELCEHYENTSQKWRNWCDDVAIYAVANFVFNDIQIPICIIPNEIDRSRIH